MLARASPCPVRPLTLRMEVRYPRLDFHELRALRAPVPRRRRGVSIRDRHQQLIEVAGSRFALMLRRGVPFLLLLELPLLDAHVRRHPFLGVCARELEGLEIDQVPA